MAMTMLVLMEPEGACAVVTSELQELHLTASKSSEVAFRGACCAT